VSSLPEYTIMNSGSPLASHHQLVNRAQSPAVALETTLLLHGVPSESARPLCHELNQIVRTNGAHPALIALVHGVPTVGLTDDELDLLLSSTKVPKANLSNLGILMHRRSHAATTVSTTMELAAAAGVRLFATGGLGGAHKGFGSSWDVSSDLAALTRFPVAVVTSGTKSILDVNSTREMLETLGVPVVGFQTDTFPAFYLRESDRKVDARFDDVGELASFIAFELARTGRGIVVANPIPRADELDHQAWKDWLAQAQATVGSQPAGRDATPRLLAALHTHSAGATLRANLALIRSNTELAARLASCMPSP
jgi:pseudouridine-5'-phosphate glycosidase